MNSPIRPSLRDIFLTGDRRLEVFFYTSNVEKFLHASTVFGRAGLILKHFKSKTDPYAEDYTAGKEALLTRAIREILSVLGARSLFFVEDTSLRIEALSIENQDYPGLSVKEWFSSTTFDRLDAELKQRNCGRAATIKSDIGLHVPGLPRPLFFHGQSEGVIAETPPAFAENRQYPWLTPNTFNGWFIPNGASKRLGEMSLEESWQFDFRTKALEGLISRLEEYAAILNLPPHAYSRSRQSTPTTQLEIFQGEKPVLVVVGKTCAGKTTFGERASYAHSFQWFEASSVLRTFKSGYDVDPSNDFDFAKIILESKGPDIVARKILQLCEGLVYRGIVISGFRTIEELETIQASIPGVQVILIEAGERVRFQRHLARGRIDTIRNLRTFRTHDLAQWSFGLLRVAEDFADVRIINEGALEDYWQQIDFLLSSHGKGTFPGVSRVIRPKHGLEDNQLFRCLVALATAGRSLSCDEIEERTGNKGQGIRHNNANKVLRKVPELAKRYELPKTRLRYEITNAGRAYIRYMAARFQFSQS